MKTLVTTTIIGFLFLGFCSCAPQRPKTQDFTPETATQQWSIAALNEIVTVGNRKLYPTGGVKITGFVADRYKGGPVGKEMIEIVDSKTNATSAKVFCLRVVPPGGATTKIGDAVTIAGTLARSSAKDNIFINDCTLLSSSNK